MSMALDAASPPRNYAKWVLVAVMTIMVVLAVSADERFLIDSTDAEWKHIANFKWWLLPHGLAGATALFLGPFQFSSSFRRKHIALHRLMGRVYIGAIVIASLLSLYITHYFEPREFQLQVWAQGGGWFLCAVLAFIYAVKRNIPLHRQWVARSYGFTFIFIAARAPDFFKVHWKTEADFVDYLWMLVFLALVVPDIILQWNDLWRRRAKSRAA